ncbi:MAG: type II toxin-antitoxin system RelE/ParE family toxin [Candidatus Saccharimonas sp.]|nr:type II toxin-antitoxin system RelE/ParE family toxin [Planctomycetaceae bacterium]
MPRHVVSPLARQDIKGIYKYIARDNPVAARQLRARIVEKLRLIGHNPEFGEPCEELQPGLRFTLVGNYVIYYLPEQTRVAIVRVLHGARDRDQLL